MTENLIRDSPDVELVPTFAALLSVRR